MSQIAFVWNNTAVYWSGIVIALSAAAAMLMALGLRLVQRQGALDMAVSLPFAVVFSLVFARLVHWYCYYRQYTGLSQAIHDLSVGAFCLTGVFAGTLLVFVLVHFLGINRDLGSLLDAAAPAAALGIGVGRFSAMFNSYDRGNVVFTDPALQGLPFSTRLTDIVGTEEWRAAVFAWEGIAALLICIVLLVFFVLSLKRRFRPGTVFWLFVLLYSAVEIVFDSMRYDSAFFRSNGFVSQVQIVGVLSMILEMILFSVRSLRRKGFRVLHPICWVVFLAGVGLASYMEYYVQRHSDLYLFAYRNMTIGMLLCTAAVLVIFTTVWKPERAIKGGKR